MDYSKLNPILWRTIAFEGRELPPTIMAIALLGGIVGKEDRELRTWLMEFVDCRGTVRTSSSYDCFRHAIRARDVLLDHRSEILAEIETKLASEGFTPADTFRDWMNALQAITEIAARTEDDCEWCAPGHPGEAAIVTKQLDAMRWFLGGQG